MVDRGLVLLCIDLKVVAKLLLWINWGKRKTPGKCTTSYNILRCQQHPRLLKTPLLWKYNFKALHNHNVHIWPQLHECVFFFFADKQSSSAGLHFKGFKLKCVLNYDQRYYCVSSDSHQITAKHLLNVCVLPVQQTQACRGKPIPACKLKLRWKCMNAEESSWWVTNRESVILKNKSPCCYNIVLTKFVLARSLFTDFRLPLFLHVKI